MANKGVTDACFECFGTESVKAAEGLAKDLHADSSDVWQGKDLRGRLDWPQRHGGTERGEVLKGLEGDTPGQCG